MIKQKEIVDTLGLVETSLGLVESTSIDVGDDVGKGFVAPERGGVEQFLNKYQELKLASQAAEEMGFRLNNYLEWPELICLWLPDGISMELRVGDDDEGVYRFSDKEVAIDFSERQELVALVNEKGEGLALQMKNDELWVGQLLRLPRRQTFEGVETPLEKYLEASTDEWIIEEGRRRLARKDTWEELVGLGHLIRHEEIDELQREALVKKLLEGGLLEKKERVLRWAANELEDEAASQLAARTDSVLEGLFEELEELRLEYERGETIDVDLLRPVFERRDDAQSAWYLLRQRSRIREMLSPLVEEVDSRGRELVDDYRLEDVRVSSRQLRRASISDAWAWWTVLV